MGDGDADAKRTVAGVSAPVPHTSPSPCTGMGVAGGEQPSRNLGRKVEGATGNQLGDIHVATCRSGYEERRRAGRLPEPRRSCQSSGALESTPSRSRDDSIAHGGDP